MLGLWTERRRTTSVRTRLGCEYLEERAQPSDLNDPPPSAPYYYAGQPPAPNQPPVIVDFKAVEISNGVFLFTGKVVDESPGGLTVTLDGSCQSITNVQVVTESDGSFSYVAILLTNGNDVGNVTADTVDNQGLAAEQVFVYVSPTP